VRHPGYLGAWICELGIVLAFGSAATLPLAPAMAWALAARVRREEALLESRFGERFRDYRRRTGGFLPHLGGGR
jgi:protein-S-isoprenylcysteine O-methyltransferase Ste14